MLSKMIHKYTTGAHVANSKCYVPGSPFQFVNRAVTIKKQRTVNSSINVHIFRLLHVLLVTLLQKLLTEVDVLRLGGADRSVSLSQRLRTVTILLRIETLFETHPTNIVEQQRAVNVPIQWGLYGM